MTGTSRDEKIFMAVQIDNYKQLPDMKSNASQFKCLMLVAAFLFVSFKMAGGQEKFSLSAGIGYPELFNAGIRYQLNQSQVGLSIGGFPASGYSGTLVSFSGNYYYHFAGFSKFTDSRLWYGRIGLNCTREYLSEVIDSWNSNFRIGRDFYFAQNFGIGMDAGLNYHFNSDLTGNPALAVALGIGCFYRF